MTAKSITIEQFHTKLVEYHNACVVLDMHTTHAFATGQFDEPLRIEALKALTKKETLEEELVDWYIQHFTSNKNVDRTIIRRIFIYEIDELLKATA